MSSSVRYPMLVEPLGPFVEQPSPASYLQQAPHPHAKRRFRGYASSTEVFSATITTGIVFDATSTSGWQSLVSSFSWSHTCTGTDRALFVGISLPKGRSVTDLTYNGVSLTLIASIDATGASIRTELWGMAAPASGTNTIAVTLSGAPAFSVGHACSFYNVDQTTPYEAANTAEGTNSGVGNDASVTVTTITDNDWVIDMVTTDDLAITVGSGQTERQNTTDSSFASGGMSTFGPKTPAGGRAMTWSNMDTTATWASAGVGIVPLGGGAPAFDPATGFPYWPQQSPVKHRRFQGWNDLIRGAETSLLEVASLIHWLQPQREPSRHRRFQGSASYDLGVDPSTLEFPTLSFWLQPQQAPVKHVRYQGLTLTVAGPEPSTLEPVINIHWFQPQQAPLRHPRYQGLTALVEVNWEAFQLPAFDPAAFPHPPQQQPVKHPRFQGLNSFVEVNWESFQPPFDPSSFPHPPQQQPVPHRFAKGLTGSVYVTPPSLLETATQLLWFQPQQSPVPHRRHQGLTGAIQPLDDSLFSVVIVSVSVPCPYYPSRPDASASPRQRFNQSQDRRGRPDQGDVQFRTRPDDCC